jgi:hypothetical protein
VYTVPQVFEDEQVKHLGVTTSLVTDFGKDDEGKPLFINDVDHVTEIECVEIVNGKLTKDHFHTYVKPTDPAFLKRCVDTYHQRLDADQAKKLAVEIRPSKHKIRIQNDSIKIITDSFKEKYKDKNIILTQNLDKNILEILRITADYKHLTQCYFNLTNEFFRLEVKDNNVTEVFVQKINAYKYWKTYQLNLKTKSIAENILNICKTVGINHIADIERNFYSKNGCTFS